MVKGIHFCYNIKENYNYVDVVCDNHKDVESRTVPLYIQDYLDKIFSDFDKN